MKKLSFLFLSLCISLAAMAQSNDPRVAEIRKMYTEAKKNIEASERKEKQGQPSNITRAVSNYRLGHGAGKVTTTYYFNEKDDEELERYFFQPYFIVNNFNTPGNKYYQEFLFDEEGDLAFYYEKNEGNETRFYFSKNGDGDEGLVHEINSSSRTIEPPFALRIAHELGNAFHLLMNREF